MSGPKSSAATIEARRFRLNELLLAGKTPAEAGEVLLAEGYPGSSHDRIQDDVKDMALVWRRDNAEGYAQVLSDQFVWLQQLKKDLTSDNIKDGDKISLALSILDREMRLCGTEAPSKSVSTRFNVDGDVADPSTLPEYRRWLYETRFMDAATKEKMFQLIAESGLNKRIHKTIEVPDNSPLWDQPTPQLPEGSK